MPVDLIYLIPVSVLIRRTNEDFEYFGTFVNIGGKRSNSLCLWESHRMCETIYERFGRGGCSPERERVQERKTIYVR